MLRLASRTTRAATAGLLGLLVAAPPPSALADDEDHTKRHRGEAARVHRDDDGRRARDERNERRRRDSGRNFRREQVRRPDPHPVRHVRDGDWDRHESRDRYRHVRREDRHEHHDRGEWRDRSDRNEWRDRHEHRDYRRYARRDDRHDHRWHWHGDRWCPPGHRSPPGRRIGWVQHRDDWRWARYRRPVVVHSPYYCAPCSHWYGDRYDFDRHVYGFHRVPERAFADLVAQLAWGWVFFGI